PLPPQPAIDVSELGPIAAVLISHAHFDHLDPPTLRRLASIDHLVLPGGADRYVEDIGAATIDQLVEGECATVKALEICATHAQHNGNRNHPFASRTRALGYVIRSGNDAIYYSGDTGASVD